MSAFNGDMTIRTLVPQGLPYNESNTNGKLWNIMDFPAPVGKLTKILTSFSIKALIASFCSGNKPYLRKFLPQFKAEHQVVPVFRFFFNGGSLSIIYFCKKIMATLYSSFCFSVFPQKIIASFTLLLLVVLLYKGPTKQQACTHNPWLF